MSRTLRGCLVLALTVGFAPGGIVFAQDLAMITDPAAVGVPAVSAEKPAEFAGPPHPATDPVRIFSAIAGGDIEALRLALNAGCDPDAPLPQPAPTVLRERFPTGPLEYYLRREVGFTPLMFAAALGDERAVRFLLAAGADPHQRSRTSRTFPLYLAARAGNVELMKLLMGITPGSVAAEFRIDVDLTTQRLTVWKGSEPIIFSPISSGKKSKPTPRGAFLVTDKHRDWTSTIFRVKMPYFLRFSCGDFGLHQGVLPGYPASSGCIRLPEAKAKEIFAAVPIGTLVEVR